MMKKIFISFLTVVFISINLYAEETVLDKKGTITLELQSVSIFDVFKILSKQSNLNIVAGKNIQGQVSIYLQNVPVREALKTILQSQNLAGIEEGGIIKILTEDDYIKKYGHPYEDTRETHAFTLKNAKAEDIAAKLSEIKSPYGRIVTESRTNTLILTEIPQVLTEMELLIRETDHPQETSIFKLDYSKAEELEPKLKTFIEGAGKIEIDKRSNTVVVMDTGERVQRARDLIEAFDVKEQQVLIEAKIVEVRLSDSYRKGIDWQEILDHVGNMNNLQALAPLAVSPPAGAAALATLSLGGGADDLQIVLNLLEQVGKTNLLSSPRLIVLNNQEAKLAVATREPFVSQTVVQTLNSTNTADNVQFVDVGVTLKVHPHISQNDVVEMTIKPEVSSSNKSLELEGVSQGSDTAFTRTRIPVVTTQMLETTVQVQSGHTLVIGGLIQDQQSKDSQRIPLLGRIPFFGRLFESKTNDFSKTELVMFLTPTIVRPDEASNSLSKYINQSGWLKRFDQVGGYHTDIRYDTFFERRDPYWDDRKQADPKQNNG